MRLAILAVAAMTLTACQSTPDTPAPIVAAPQPPPAAGSARLDSNVIVVPPDPRVPKAYAAYSGIWSGTWDGPLDAKLAVRSVAANGRVTVTYAWGEMGTMKPGIVDGQGRISGGSMRLDRFASGVDAAFTMQPDGTLAATYSVSGMSYNGVFRRQ